MIYANFCIGKSTEGDSMVEIREGVWIGDQYVAESKGLLEDNEIKNILNTTRELPNYYENIEDDGFDYIKLSLRDNET